MLKLTYVSYSKNTKDMANPNPKHKFSSTNQPPPRGKSYRTVLLEALRACNNPMGEVEFVTYYIDQAMKEGDAGMLREIFLRLNPIPKPVAPPIEFDFPSDGTPVQKMDAIIKGVSTGVVPADIGKMMADIIKSGLDIQEITELAARLERLEKLLEQQNV